MKPDEVRMSEERYRELIEARQSYESLVNTIDGIVWEADARTFRFRFVSKQAERLLGYPVERWTNEPTFWRDHLHPEDRDWAVQYWVSATQRKMNHEMVYRMMAANGTVIWLRDIVTVITKDDEPVLLRGIMVDVSERRIVEDALDRLRNQNQLLLESAGEGIYGQDLSGAVSFINPAFARMLGYETDELIGEDLHRIAHYAKADGSPLSVDECAIHQVIRDGVPRHVTDEVFWKKDGTPVPVEYAVTPMKEGEQIVGSVVVIRDVSERNQLQQQLVQAQKLEGIAQLAGGMAHDFNNVLTVILGRTRLLMQQVDSADPIQQSLEPIYAAGMRASSLIRQLMAFSRKQVLQLRVVDLNAVVTETQYMLGSLIGEDIEFRVVLEKPLGPVKADKVQLEQVLMNLLLNARDAMPAGGKLGIRTANVHLDQAFCAKHPEVSPGAYVLLSVSDSGTGMDAETQAHVFEPFFTTKMPGKGSGLGLSMVYGMVRQAGGCITVSSTKGQGTAFEIFFPRVEHAAEVPGPAVQPAEPAKGSETILLVEDDDDVRELARRVLESGGYTVLPASRGEKALQISQQHSETIHLVLSDVIMPGMSGPEFVRRFAVQRPDTKVVFMSANVDRLTEQLPADAAFIAKPFSNEDLLSTLRAVFQEPSGVRS
jgi:two-component system cell cycle sensor histidine kinase/response regulator CckA